jgi:nucleotide-binding universal stress UspA family protein
LAAVDDSAVAATVIRAAEALAAEINSPVEVVHVGTADAVAGELAARWRRQPFDVVTGDAADQIVAAASAPDVRVVVVGARSQRGGKRPAGGVALAVLTRVERPVLVVPPDAQLPRDGRFRRVLCPLEGTPSSSRAMDRAVRELLGATVAVHALHVFAPTSPRRFWDQHGHAGETWVAEFRHRWCSAPGIELHLRSGDVGSAVLDLIHREQIDLVVLGWSRNLANDRAGVVREVLGHSPVPVLLLPVDDVASGAEKPAAGGASRG